MQQDKSRVKSKSHIDSAIYKVQSQDRGQVGKGQLGPFHHHDGSQHESVSCKEGLYPSMSCGLPLRGKVTQDTIQEVQSQDMESRGAITKVETTRCKDRNPRHQVIRQGEVLVKRVLSPHIPSREF